MPTRLEIVQRAQARIGDEPLRAETDAGADTHLAIYDSVRDDLLTRFPWTWATITRRLTRLVTAPGAHWSYFYQLPSDMLGAPRAVYDRSDARIPFTGYELTENRLATNAEEIWLRYAKRADPGLWPGYFVELLTIAVMAELAMSVREDRVMQAHLLERAFGPAHLNGEGGLFAHAAAIDTQARPSPIVAEGSNPLIDARF